MLPPPSSSIPASAPGEVGRRSRIRTAAGWLARSRLLHFVVLGAIVFAIAPRSRAPGRDVRLDAGTLSALRAERARRLRVRTLSAEESSKVEARAIEDEVLVREALRLGLDQEDPILRQRLVQKMLFVAEETAGASRPPTDPDLEAYFERTKAQWKRPARIAFVHVVARSEERAAALLPQVTAWAEGAPREAVPPFGDPLPVSRSVSFATSELAAGFGPAFAAAVAQAPVDAWSGPFPSRHGHHLVRVLSRSDEGQATLAEVREDVRAALVQDRRQRAVNDYLRSAVARYHIEVEGRPVTSLSPTDRTAARGEASGED
jgi:peptidyl-prolyl cis-trans isomerase C